MINIFTVKTGRKYGPEYVNNMLAMLKRFMPFDFEFYCYTDDFEGLDSGIKLIDKVYPLEGWWNKIAFFSPLRPEGKTLLLDLDQVITGPLDFIEKWDYRAPLIVGEDPYRWHGCRFGSAFMLAEHDYGRDLIDVFLQEDFDTLEKRYPAGDQQWMAAHLKHYTFVEDHFGGVIASYKRDCKDRGLDPKYKIVNFHGPPKPHEAPDPWIKYFWTSTHNDTPL